MTRIEMYSKIATKFGYNSFDAKMFYSAMKQEDTPKSMLEGLYKSIMKKKQGS